MKEVYLDNAATTEAAPEVIEKINYALTNAYGNPSSLHNKGLEAEKLVKEARQIIADKLKVKPREIYFTSGGTEANNLAILGTVKALKNRGNRVITTKIEHPSVLSVFEHLKEEGWEVKYLDVDQRGIIDLEQLKKYLNSDTVLVSIIGVNNELGTIQPIDEIVKLTKKYDNLYFHVDGIQALGKVDIFPAKSGIDLFSISAHKINGPKGVGALYVNSDIRIQNIIYGSEQEAGIRPGTENVPGIAGFGKAVELLSSNLDQMYQLKEKLVTGIINHLPYSQLNGPTIEEGASHIVNISFADIKGEVLVHSLEEDNIYASTGSACHSRHSEASHVLRAIGVNSKYIDGTLRFSLSPQTTRREIDYTVEALKNKVPTLRKYMGGAK